VVELRLVDGNAFCVCGLDNVFEWGKGVFGKVLRMLGWEDFDIGETNL